jgi:hypothetical protein
MVDGRPYSSVEALFCECHCVSMYQLMNLTYWVFLSCAAVSDKIWAKAERDDILEAFSAHPKIGDTKGAAQHGGV